MKDYIIYKITADAVWKPIGTVVTKRADYALRAYHAAHESIGISEGERLSAKSRKNCSVEDCKRADEEELEYWAAEWREQ